MCRVVQAGNYGCFGRTGRWAEEAAERLAIPQGAQRKHWDRATTRIALDTPGRVQYLGVKWPLEPRWLRSCSSSVLPLHFSPPKEKPQPKKTTTTNRRRGLTLINRPVSEHRSPKRGSLMLITLLPTQIKNVGENTTTQKERGKTATHGMDGGPRSHKEEARCS